MKIIMKISRCDIKMMVFWCLGAIEVNILKRVICGFVGVMA